MNKIKELIPEFFYDLIARITPGAILLFAVGWHFREHIESLCKLNDSILVILALIVSYVSGFCLDHISGILFILPDLLVRHASKILPFFNSSVWEVNTWKVLRSTPDDRQTIVLLKMTAEKTMVRSMGLTWLLLWVLDIPPIGDLVTFIKFVGLLVFIVILYRKDYYLHHDAQKIEDQVSRSIDR